MSTLIDDVLVKLIECCGAQMKTLKIDNCLSFSDISVMKFTANCPLLQDLSMIQNRNITHKSLSAVVENCIFLRVLDITGCVSVCGDFLKAIVAHADCLTHLHILECPLIDKNDVLRLLTQYHKLLKFDYDSAVYSFYAAEE
jgi:hypothetical protein